MTSITDITGTGAGSGAARRSLADNFDNFLTMLTTQLENQDPLSPMDSTEFTNQLVQFSSLEQQIAGNDKLDNVLASNKSVEAAASVQYLGKTVELVSNATFLTDGAATISYVLPADVSEAKISIYNQAGDLVQTLDADTASGRTDLAWDGKNSQGLQLEDGTYTVVVAGKDAEGEAMDSIPTYTSGPVKEVINDGGETYVLVNDLLARLSDVKSIMAAAN